tara:strand:- start:7853 stop:8359 length:507 start_codon:yes stop_codon:yes gene_type:complete
MEPITAAYLAYQSFKIGTEIFGLFSDRNQDIIYGQRIYREKQYAKLSAAQTINILINQGEELENSNRVLEGASGKEFDPTSGSYRVIQSTVAQATADDIQATTLSGNIELSKLDQLREEHKRKTASIMFGRLGNIGSSVYEGYDFWAKRQVPKRKFAVNYDTTYGSGE